jgi:hypothetical protein
MSIERVDGGPPPVDYGMKGEINWHTVASTVKEIPGEWVRIKNVARSTPAAIRRGAVAALRPPSDYEVEQRRDPDLPLTRTTLYIRYVG